MGSDLYMESRNWNPRPTKVSWVDNETIKIETDTFYHGYKPFYEGPVTERILGSMDVLHVTLPAKPARFVPGEEVQMRLVTAIVDYDMMVDDEDVYTVKFKAGDKTYLVDMPGALLERI